MYSKIIYCNDQKNFYNQYPIFHRFDKVIIFYISSDLGYISLITLIVYKSSLVAFLSLCTPIGIFLKEDIGGYKVWLLHISSSLRKTLTEYRICQCFNSISLSNFVGKTLKLLLIYNITSIVFSYPSSCLVLILPYFFSLFSSLLSLCLFFIPSAYFHSFSSASAVIPPNFANLSMDFLLIIHPVVPIFTPLIFTVFSSSPYRLLKI